MLKRLRSLFGVLTRRRDFEDGMTEELDFHIEQYTDDLVRSGMSPEKATRHARMEFGSLDSVRGDCREERGLHLFDEFRRELSYAARLLRKTPGFTATALLTLAVCFGANLTIFAVIESVLLRPLPFPVAGSLVTIFNTYPKAGVDRDGSSLTNYYERRGHIPAFTSISIYGYGTEIVGEPGSTEREPTMRVSPDFFSTLGFGPVIGRTFTEEETTSDQPCCYSFRHILAATIQRRSQCARKTDSCKWRSQNRDRRPASRLPLSFFRCAVVPPACFAP
jgi:putative ABC transport system permease protein